MNYQPLLILTLSTASVLSLVIMSVFILSPGYLYCHCTSLLGFVWYQSHPGLGSQLMEAERNQGPRELASQSQGWGAGLFLQSPLLLFSWQLFLCKRALFHVYILQVSFMIFRILFCELRGGVLMNLLSDYIGLSWMITLARTLQIDSLFEIRMSPVPLFLALSGMLLPESADLFFRGSLISIYSYEWTVRKQRLWRTAAVQWWNAPALRLPWVLFCFQ